MRRERNLFVEAFGALYALHWLALAYLVVNCTITIVDTWFVDSRYTWFVDRRYFVYLYAPLGSVFYFLMFGRLLKVVNPQRSLKQFAAFSVWYLCIFFVFTVGGADLVLYLFEAAPETIVEQDSFIAGYFIFTLLLLFAPTYFLGTLLPAKILKRSDSFRAALQRALRQTGYLLPRYVGIYVPLLLVSGILYGAMQEGGPELQPVTPTGDIHVLGFVVMVISNLISITAEAVLIVMLARAYLKDLRELGDFFEHDAEVFA